MSIAAVSAVVGCLVWLLPGLALAQGDKFHWAYASYFGTGVYTLDDTETIVIAMTPAWTWRDAVLDDSGKRTIGYRFRAPVSVAVTEFSSLDQIGELDIDSIGAISVVPGVEIDIPMTARWRLKPIAYLGFGHETGGGDSAEIFRIGLRSQLVFELEQTGMKLVNSLERIGYSPDQGSPDALNLFNIGLDFSRPLVNSTLGGDPVALNWHVMYTRYLDSLGLDISRSSVQAETLSSEWELGVAFSKASGRIGWWRLRFDRVGIAYRLGADGEFSGIGIVFKSLFDR